MIGDRIGSDEESGARSGNEALSARLARTVTGAFFRPLARPSAPIYIDCADRLAESSDEGGQVSHPDALALIRDVLAAHPRAELEEDEGAQFSDLRQRAGQIFNRLLEAGWVQDRVVSLDERWVLLAPRLRPLLRLLRELAENDPAELRDFAATLRSICATLACEGILDPNKHGPEEFRQTVKELLDRTTRAADQMHGVESLILQEEEKQRASASGAETLQRFLVEFHSGEHMVCYDVLQKGGLLPQLNRARQVAQEAAGNPFAKQRLAEGLMEHVRSWTMTEAYAEAERLLNKLERSIGGIRNKSQLIDGRMADFSKLSAQRYRYQTEIRGKRPEQVKQHLQSADAEHAGSSFAELSSLPGMELLSPNVTLYFGRDALARARKARTPASLRLEAFTPEIDALSAQDLIRKRNMTALTPQRAGKFVEKHLPEKGGRVSSDAFALMNEDDLLDLLAVLGYEKCLGPAGVRPVVWRVLTQRSEFGLSPENIPSDPQAGKRVERFSIERTS